MDGQTERIAKKQRECDKFSIMEMGRKEGNESEIALTEECKQSHHNNNKKKIAEQSMK